MFPKIAKKEIRKKKDSKLEVKKKKKEEEEEVKTEPQPEAEVQPEVVDVAPEGESPKEGHLLEFVLDLIM